MVGRIYLCFWQDHQPLLLLLRLGILFKVQELDILKYEARRMRQDFGIVLCLVSPLLSSQL